MKKLGNKSVVIQNQDIQGILSELPVQGKRMMEPLKTFSKTEGVSFNILEDTAVSNDAEVHTHEADLWGCLQGEVTFTIGGEMVDPKPSVGKNGHVNERELKAKQIKGGSEIVLKPGDWLWIPAGEPHLHKAEGTARLIIIKIPNVQ